MELRVEIANPAGKIVQGYSSEINQDDWLPNMTAKEYAGETLTLQWLEGSIR